MRTYQITRYRDGGNIILTEALVAFCLRSENLGRLPDKLYLLRMCVRLRLAVDNEMDFSILRRRDG